jgi:hypothetical protein|tara:strand:- start:12 stop:437 length:426 start_codon:yes stop_codon:yes gene_type:complete
MKYETVKDRERQKKASDLFCQEFDLISIDRGEFASVDYDLRNKRGYIVGSLEVKGCPDRNIDDALTCQVAIRKLVDLQKYQKKTKKPVAICWAFEDGIVYERIENLEGTFRLGGRNPRQESYNDIEIMARVEIKKLKKVCY